MEKVKHQFAEPMNARVWIRNISQFDITIGPDGVIRNDLWFDAQFRGLVQQAVTGAAYERLGQALVLKPNQEIVQTFRMDQGQLAQVLAGNPQPTLAFWGTVRTNPRGDGGTSPGGYGVMFSAITEREGFVINNNNIVALNQMANGEKPELRIRGLEMMSVQVEQIRAQPPGPQSDVLIKGFLQNIGKAANDDAMPAVATWAQFLIAARDAAVRPAAVAKMVADPDPTRRVMGLLIAHALPPEQQKALLKQVANDAEEMVRTYATGMTELVQFASNRPPARAPSSATLPTIPPPGTVAPGPSPVPQP
jgi:hypothetical protein